MATRVELPKEQVARALNMAIASAKRAANSSTINPAMKVIHEKDVAEYTTAVNTLTDAK